MAEERYQDTDQGSTTTHKLNTQKEQKETDENTLPLKIQFTGSVVRQSLIRHTCLECRRTNTIILRVVYSKVSIAAMTRSLLARAQDRMPSLEVKRRRKSIVAQPYEFDHSMFSEAPLAETFTQIRSYHPDHQKQRNVIAITSQQLVLDQEST